MFAVVFSQLVNIFALWYPYLVAEWQSNFDIMAVYKGCQCAHRIQSREDQ